MNPVVVWHRVDLRLADNPALAAAADAATEALSRRRRGRRGDEGSHERDDGRASLDQF
ncbi:deoxyribodipyrimidine photo-lyase [Haloarchaeobius iranensis]|uniref:DNA photolyase n=1 Tax=Haloarchaeobius iranensis TaxID=996166 RepID=A0A1G9V1L4_9EURY|nr:deoxyribodipyrimidine photo-lyase [Haloarchaeobius iranensis]SDM65775.1 DNA photolyase [Haloarchaeobius iranensis]